MRWVLLDEFQLSFSVPRDISPALAKSMARLIRSRRFNKALHTALRNAIRAFPTLKSGRWTVGQ